MNRFRRQVHVGLVLSLCLLALVGCRQQPSTVSDVDVRIYIISPPAVVERSSRVEVIVADSAGSPISGAKIDIEGNMRHAGMTPVIAQAVEDSAGRYVVAAFTFTMGGDWVVTARALLPDGRRIERSVDVPGVTTRGGVESRPRAPSAAPT